MTTTLTMLDQRELLDGHEHGYQAFNLSQRSLAAFELRFRNGDIKQRPYANLAVDMDARGVLTLISANQRIQLEGQSLRDRKFLDGLLDRRVRWIAEHPDGLVRPEERGQVLITRISVETKG